MKLERKTFVERKMEQCRHFTGVQHDTCAAGVAYKDVRDETTRPFGFACLGAYAGNATCAKREWITREEAEAEERESEAAFERINTCLKAIREAHGTARGLQGEMPCPVKCGGLLRYSIAGVNGHVHGQCSTPGCASWMQ